MGTLSFFWLGLWLISLSHWCHFFFHYCRAVLSLTRFCTFLFPPTHILFSHLTCGTNAKWQDRRLWVCMLNIFSKSVSDSCAWMCAWMQTRAVYSSGWVSTCFMGAYVRAGSAQVILVDLNLETVCVSQKNTLVWVGVFYDFTVWFPFFFFFSFPVCRQHNHWLVCVLCWLIRVDTLMYIPRPKHLQIQVTHGKHL